MQMSSANAILRVRPKAQAVFGRGFVPALALLAGILSAVSPAATQERAPVEVKQIASDLYFFYDFNGSNAVFLVTEEGVLLIDTLTHPRVGRDLLDRIRKVTDKPVKWVINSHFHGDHQMGNSVFKALGATFVAQNDTARIMQQVHPKEMARRIEGFKSRGYDPDEVKLVLPDVTFDSEMTIRLGGREVRLFYLGPGQQAGDTFVQFPHARVLFTPGAFAKHSMPNMAFTPSVDNWLKLLDQVAAMDVDTILPAHGDVATRADVKELAAMLADEYATVKDAANRGVPLDQAVKTLTFPQYRDWRNYRRLDGEIKALYELIQTGKRSYLE
jgi:glyoxylase-like metal-dependent hydrolase (beta-lactamase superfamily II)